MNIRGCELNFYIDLLGFGELGFWVLVEGVSILVLFFFFMYGVDICFELCLVLRKCVS